MHTVLKLKMFCNNSLLVTGFASSVQNEKSQQEKSIEEITTKATRSSAIAEGPRDASCQLKSCQLPRNSAETTCTTRTEQIEVMKLEG